MQKLSARSEFGRMLRSVGKKIFETLLEVRPPLKKVLSPSASGVKNAIFVTSVFFSKQKLFPNRFIWFFQFFEAMTKDLGAGKSSLKMILVRRWLTWKSFLLLWPQREWFDPSFWENDSKWVKEKSEKWNLSLKLLFCLLWSRSDTLKLLHNDFFVSPIKALSLAH